MTEKQKYVLVAGRHRGELNGEQHVFIAGDEIMLTPEEAAKFVNKFELASEQEGDPNVHVAPPATTEPQAPTVEDLANAIAFLPKCFFDTSDEFDDAAEALSKLREVFGELVTDDLVPQVEAAFKLQQP